MNKLIAYYLDELIPRGDKIMQREYLVYFGLTQADIDAYVSAI